MNFLPAFRDNLSAPFSRVKQYFKDDADRLFRYVGKKLPFYVALNPKRAHISVLECKFLILGNYYLDILYLREKGYEDPWLLFEAKRGPGEKKFGKQWSKLLHHPAFCLYF